MACSLAMLVLKLPAGMQPFQDRMFDAMILAVQPAGDPVLSAQVVDIGATDETGAPWDRGDSARLAKVLADADPAVVAYDMVFSEDCAATDANETLVAALRLRPSVLGFLLAEAGQPPPARPSLAFSEGAAHLLWRARGAEAACPSFGDAATAATVAFASERGGRLRKAPIGVVVGTAAYGSLAVEAVRVALGEAAILLGSQPSPWLRIGGKRVPLDSDGRIRLQP